MHLDVIVDDLDAAERAVLELGATKHEHQPGRSSACSSTPPGTRSASAFREPVRPTVSSRLSCAELPRSSMIK